MEKKFRFSANILHRNEKKIYRMINALLLACAVLFGGSRFLGAGELTPAHLAAALAVLGLWAAMTSAGARGRILCLFAALACLCTVMISVGGNTFLSFFRGYFPWLMGGGAGEEEWALWYELVQTGILTGLCCLPQVLYEKIPLLKAGTALLFLAGLVFCIFTQTKLTYPGVVSVMGYLVLVYAEWVQSRWEKVRGTRTGTQMLWLAPFLAGYLLLMAFMPVPEKPYEWKWAKNLYQRLRDSFLVYTQGITWGIGEGFDMSLSGFSEDGELGGNTGHSAREVMQVRIENGRVSNLYLTGMTYDTFDGRQWTQEYEGDSQTVFLDAAETFCAVYNYNERYLKDYLDQMRIRIRHEYFNTGYVFAPLKTYEIDGGREAEYAFEGGNLTWSRRRGYGTEYRVKYEQLNIGQEEFYRFLEAGRSADTAVWEEALQKYNRGREVPVSLSELEEYRGRIQEEYLGGVLLSPEAEGCLERITGDAGTDVEKLRAIERELSSYTYTRTPGSLPEEIGNSGEFLDYFLLESKRGYCSYFATAFVLLARAEGIPARYVQGFCVPVEGTGEITVYSHMAHAWPEAYIEGVGWIPFEPTPGYGELRYEPWRLSQKTSEALHSGEEQETGAPEETETDAEQEETEEPGEAVEEREEGWTDAFRRGLRFALPAAAVMCVLLLAAEKLSERRRYGRMSVEDRFRVQVERNLRVLSLMGLERGEQETLQEFRARALLHRGREKVSGKATPGSVEEDGAAGRNGTEEAEETALRFLVNYEELVYGGKAAGPGALEGAIRERRRLMEVLKKERRWVWLYCRLRYHSFYDI